MFDTFKPAWHQGLDCPNYPYDTVRQSGLSLLRECGHKFVIMANRPDIKGTSEYTFGGTVYHEAVEDKFKNPRGFRERAECTEYWLDIAERTDAPPELNKREFAYKAARRDTLDGLSLCDTIEAFYNMNMAIGLNFKGAEISLNFDVGKTKFEGTMDLLLEHKNGLVIVDTKTSGLFKPFFQKATTQKQTYSRSQVSFMPQLVHYHWMGWRSKLFHPAHVKRYMIFTPANLMRYKRGKNAGEFKGPMHHPGDAANEDRLLMYEDSVRKWLKRVRTNNLGRDYPNIFGKILCDKCPAQEACFSANRIKKPSFLPNTGVE